MDIDSKITEFLTDICEDIATNMEVTKSNASGRTVRSLEIQQAPNRGRIVGRPFFRGVEEGRPSGAVPENFNAIIKKWIVDKRNRYGFNLRIVPYKTDRPHKYTEEERSLNMAAGAIAAAIKNRGTKLYREGGRIDIYTVAINENLAKFEADLRGVAETEIKEDLRIIK